MQNIQPKTIFNVEKKLLKINDSIRVSININDLFSKDYSIKWSCNLGTIKGESDKITYVAPGTKGLAIIEVKIFDADNNFYTESFNILIYKQLIIIKADDLGFYRGSNYGWKWIKRFIKLLLYRRIDIQKRNMDRWKLFTDFIVEKRAKASLGLIGMYLENENGKLISFIKNLPLDDTFEIWNHGYDHLRIKTANEEEESVIEFKNTPLDFQKSHLLKTQHLAKEKLNLTLRTFGAPENAIDKNTKQVIDEINEIKVWFNGLDGSNKLILKPNGAIEFPFNYPSFEKFKSIYDINQSYLALQVHPMSWDENKFAEFKEVIDFLIENEVTFINPYEYYQLTTNGDQ